MSKQYPTTTITLRIAQQHHCGCPHVQQIEVDECNVNMEQEMPALAPPSSDQSFVWVPPETTKMKLAFNGLVTGSIVQGIALKDMQWVCEQCGEPIVQESN